MKRKIKLSFCILKCIKTILIHKWYVFWAGLKVKAPIFRLIIHDWSKFTPTELVNYARIYYLKDMDPWWKDHDKRKYYYCWLKHQNRNPHHWEYWMTRSGVPLIERDHAIVDTLTMSEWAVREMIADWIGASVAYTGKYPNFNNWEWYEKNKNKIQVDFFTREKIKTIIEQLRKDQKR